MQQRFIEQILETLSLGSLIMILVFWFAVVQSGAPI